MAGLDYLKKIGRTKKQLEGFANTSAGQIVADFAKEQISKMKTELSERKATGSLASSLTFKFKSTRAGVTVEFLANDYWDFINAGVNGLSRSQGSEYSFKTAFPSSKMMDAFTGTGVMRGWMATQGIRSLSWINKEGEQVTKELVTDKDFRGAAYVLARAVKQKGIESTPFVDDVFSQQAIDEFQEDIFKALDKMLE